MIVYVTILSTRCKCKAIRREINREHGTEMTMDRRQCLSENYTLQYNLESTSTLLGTCDFTRVLATSDECMEFLPILRIVKWADCDSSAGSASEVVLSDHIERLRVQQLGAGFRVTSRCEKHSVVVRECKLEDVLLVDLLFFQLCSRAHIDDQNLTCLCTDIECLIERTPDHSSELLTLDRINLLDHFRSVSSRTTRKHTLHVVDSNVCLPIFLVEHKELLIAIGHRYLQLEQAWYRELGRLRAILRVKNNDSKLRCGQNIFRVLCHIN